MTAAKYPDSLAAFIAGAVRLGEQVLTPSTSSSAEQTKPRRSLIPLMGEPPTTLTVDLATLLGETLAASLSAAKPAVTQTPNGSPTTGTANGPGPMLRMNTHADHLRMEIDLPIAAFPGAPLEPNDVRPQWAAIRGDTSVIATVDISFDELQSVTKPMTAAPDGASILAMALADLCAVAARAFATSNGQAQPADAAQARKSPASETSTDGGSATAGPGQRQDSENAQPFDDICDHLFSAGSNPSATPANDHPPQDDPASDGPTSDTPAEIGTDVATPDDMLADRIFALLHRVAEPPVDDDEPSIDERFQAQLAEARAALESQIAALTKQMRAESEGPGQEPEAASSQNESPTKPDNTTTAEPDGTPNDQPSAHGAFPMVGHDILLGWDNDQNAPAVVDRPLTHVRLIAHGPQRWVRFIAFVGRYNTAQAAAACRFAAHVNAGVQLSRVECVPSTDDRHGPGTMVSVVDLPAHALTSEILTRATWAVDTSAAWMINEFESEVQ